MRWGSGGSRVRAATDYATDLNTSSFPATISKIGPPTYDPRPAYKGRLWAMGFNISEERFRHILYSDDWGDTWTEWLETVWNTLNPLLHMTTNGDFYFSNNVGFLRVDGGTKAVALKGTWLPDEYQVSNGGWGFSWLDWPWGEFSDGTILTGCYALAENRDILDAEEAPLSAHVIWLSEDDGANWSQNTVLQDKTPRATDHIQHIHSVHVNPFTDDVWAVVGDNIYSGVYKSTDKCETFGDNTEGLADRNTGLTFTSDSVWLSTDHGYSQNYLKRFNGTSFDKVYTVPLPYGLIPVYWIRACGDNEFWTVHYNQDDTDYETHLCKHRRVGNVLELDRDYVLATNTLNGMNLKGIAHINGVIPEWSPYVFVHRTEKTDPQSLEGTIRIAR